MQHTPYTDIQQAIDDQLVTIAEANCQEAEAENVKIEKCKNAKHENCENVRNEKSIITKLRNMMKKKVLSTLLMLLAPTCWLMAQGHWTLSHEDEGASLETPVYAKLNLGSPTAEPIYENYEVAAFVNGEVRAIATCTTNPAAGNKNYFELIVRGNFGTDEADTDKAITFKLYNSLSDVEYNLTSAAITFDGLKHGELSNLFELSCVEAEMVRLADITINKGETINLMDYLEVIPVGATLPNGITWSLAPGADSYLTLTPEGMLTANAVTPVGTMLEVNYSCGTLGKSGFVTVVNPATAININDGYKTIFVNVGDKDDLNAKLVAAVSLVPADATDAIHWVSADELIVKQDDTDGKWNPIAKGTVIMSAQVLDDVGGVRLQAQITVKVTEPLTGFTFEIPTPLRAGTTEQIIVTPVPADVALDVAYVTTSVTDTESTLPTGWPLINIASSSINGSGQLVLTLDVENPGHGNFRLNYNDGAVNITSDPQPLNVGVPLALDEGWQWKTLWQDITTGDMLTAFTNNLVEIRSQNGLMANDSEYGYFGTLYDNGLMANIAYKVNINADILARNAYVMQNGTYLARSMEQSLMKGWTWIPYPYYHTYPLSGLDITGAVGDRIVSFRDGFAEFDGTNWSGSLTELNPGEAYLYYNNSGAASSFKWTDEPVVYAANPSLTPARQFGSAARLPWTYNPARFSDNMSIIAEISNFNGSLSDCMVAAFVGDECRGEGRFINGKMFITVHADKGETISFRLVDTFTGDIYDLDEQVSMSMMLGSLKKPFKLTASQTVVTSINTINDNVNDNVYDLQGRRLEQAPVKGIYIVNGKKLIR